MARGSFNERANVLAAEYWKSKERAGPTANEKARLDEIERLLARGISGALGMQLEKEANELRRVIEDKRTASSNLVAVRRDLLDLVSDFAPSLDLRSGTMFSYDKDREPLSENYFRAITEIFFGVPKIAIEFKTAVLSDKGIYIPNAEDDFASLKSLNYVTTILQEAAKKLLGRENQIDRAWRRLREKEYGFTAFEVLVNSDRTLSLSDIEKIREGMDREYQKLIHPEVYHKGLMQDLEYLIGDAWEHPLIKKRGDRFEVTDFGKWVWLICKDKDEKKPAEKKASGFGRLFRKKGAK